MSIPINIEKGKQMKKSVGDYIKQVGAFGILIAVFAIGFSIATTFWSSSVSTLNGQLAIERNEKDKINQELSQVKSDYFEYRTLSNNKDTGNNKVSQIDKIEKTGQMPFSTGATNETKEIEVGKSYGFLGGELIISLIATPFEDNPLRHKVIANISSPKGRVLSIDRKDIGSVFLYKNIKEFEIHILESGTFSATFQVYIK